PGRGRARPVRLAARRPTSTGDDPQARLDVRQPAAPAGAGARRLPVPGVGHPLGRGGAGWGQRRRRPVRGTLMRLLHTADWHVGKQLRGASRADEHRAVLDEVVAVAGANEVDLVIVAGDLFETAAPAPEAQGIVFDALLRLAGKAEVVVIAGNHDNARALGVLAPLFASSGVTVVGEACRPDAGGVHRFTAGDGAAVNVALLPFVSKRGIVRAEQLMSTAAFEQAQAYSQRM